MSIQSKDNDTYSKICPDAIIHSINLMSNMFVVNVLTKKKGF